MVEGKCAIFTGTHSSDCSFIIKGDTDYSLGHKARNSNFEVFGDNGNCIGIHAEDCLFKLHGKGKNDWEYSEMPRNCTFAVKDEEYRLALADKLTRHPMKGNKVVPL
jgi:hypothetical protein